MKLQRLFPVNGCEDIKPQSIEEKLIWWSLVLTYPLYLIGGLYLVGSILPWLLLAILIIRSLHEDPLQRPKIGWPLWMWCGFMLLMELALIVGHLNFNLGLLLIVKSSIGWAKGWASLALFPLASALKIRPKLIYRACCVVAMQSILWYVIATFAYNLRIPPPIDGSGLLYISPLKILGGSSDSFFMTTLYEIDPENQVSRFRFFAPWSPACGMVAIVQLVAAFQEKQLKWKAVGIIGAILIILGTKSRLAQIAGVLVPTLMLLISSATNPIVLYGYALISMGVGIFIPLLKIFYQSAVAQFRSQRAGSSAVRESLAEIGLYRWKHEAYVWGHGVVEDGPKLVEFMPIGSHHTWIGLLFTKGIVGFASFFIPMLASSLVLLWKIWRKKYQHASAALGILITVLLYTFAENMETLIYIYWPGAIILGFGLNERLPLEYEGQEKYLDVKE